MNNGVTGFFVHQTVCLRTGEGMKDIVAYPCDIDMYMYHEYVYSYI